MPITVPRAAPLPQVRPSALQLPTESPSLPEGVGGEPYALDLSGLQAGAQGVAQATMDIKQKAEAHADQLANLGANAQLSGLETSLMYDPDTGAMNKHGQDALSTPEQVADGWQKGISTISSTLTTDRQRLAFQAAVADRWDAINRTLQQHVSGELRTYHADQTQALIDGERTAAVASYLNPDRSRDAVDRQLAAVRDEARANGWSDEQLQATLLNTASQTHTAVLERMLADDGRTAQAKAYFDQYKDEMTGDAQTQVTKSLDESSLRSESQQLADSITSTSTTLSDALAKVRTTKDANLRDATQSRVEHYFAVQEQIKRQGQEDAYDAAAHLVDDNPGQPVRSVVPASTYAKLTLPMLDALDARAKKDQPNDDETWLSFLDLPVTKLGALSRASFETDYWSKFDDRHRERAEMMWKGAQQAVDAGKYDDPKLTSTLTFKDRVSNTLRTTGIIDPNKPTAKFSKGDASRYANFEDEAAKEVEQYELTSLGGKRHATGQEMQQILDRMVMNRVFIDKSFRSDPEELASQVTSDDMGRAYVPMDKIPGTDLSTIKNYLLSNGKKITNRKMERLYAAKQMKNYVLWDSIMGEP